MPEILDAGDCLHYSVRIYVGCEITEKDGNSDGGSEHLFGGAAVED